MPAEITTYCFYPGKVKDYLVANAIFRMGGAGVLMTNKPALIRQSKYQLMHSVRIHTGQDDAAYRCVQQLLGSRAQQLGHKAVAGLQKQQQ